MMNQFYILMSQESIIKREFENRKQKNIFQANNFNNSQSSSSNSPTYIYNNNNNYHNYDGMDDELYDGTGFYQNLNRQDSEQKKQRLLQQKLKREQDQL